MFVASTQATQNALTDAIHIINLGSRLNLLRLSEEPSSETETILMVERDAAKTYDLLREGPPFHIVRILPAPQPKKITNRITVQETEATPLRDRLRTDTEARKKFLSGIIATMAYEGVEISWDEANRWLDEVLARPPRRLNL